MRTGPVNVDREILTLAPAVTIAGYETLGHRHVAVALERL
jgi:hypothetical protein